MGPVVIEGARARSAAPQETVWPGLEDVDDTLPVVRLRHYGRWITALVALVVVAFVAKAFATGQIQWNTVGQFFTAHAILVGLGNTLLISVSSMLLGMVLGILFAVMRLSRNPVVSTIAWVYVWLFRGTPVLLQLLLWFNLALIFPTVNLVGLYHARMVDVITPFLAALLGLGINEGAYMTEIVRAGIISVDHGQTEAAQSLGMSNVRVLRRIVLPQAMRVIIPPVGNEFIGLLKTSSLASVIAFSELLYRSQQIYFANDRVIELLIVAAIWYIIVVTIFSVGQFYLERRFARGAARALPPTPLQRLRQNLAFGRPGVWRRQGGR